MYNSRPVKTYTVTNLNEIGFVISWEAVVVRHRELSQEVSRVSFCRDDFHNPPNFLFAGTPRLTFPLNQIANFEHQSHSFPYSTHFLSTVILSSQYRRLNLFRRSGTMRFIASADAFEVEHFLLKSFHSYGTILFLDLDSYRFTPELLGGDKRCSAAHEGVECQLAGVRP